MLSAGYVKEVPVNFTRRRSDSSFNKFELLALWLAIIGMVMEVVFAVFWNQGVVFSILTIVDCVAWAGIIAASIFRKPAFYYFSMAINLAYSIIYASVALALMIVLFLDESDQLLLCKILGDLSSSGFFIVHIGASPFLMSLAWIAALLLSVLIFLGVESIVYQAHKRMQWRKYTLPVVVAKMRKTEKLIQAEDETM